MLAQLVRQPFVKLQVAALRRQTGEVENEGDRLRGEQDRQGFQVLHDFQNATETLLLLVITGAVVPVGQRGEQRRAQCGRVVLRVPHVVQQRVGVRTGRKKRGNDQLQQFLL